MGIIARIIAGLVGSSVGQAIFWYLGSEFSWDGFNPICIRCNYRDCCSILFLWKEKVVICQSSREET